MMMTVPELKAVVASKGPVCLCRSKRCYPCFGCGPQRQYYRALQLLRMKGIALPDGASTARSHAIDVGEGRGEWDAIMRTAGWAGGT
jgi:hypothetical protein